MRFGTLGSLFSAAAILSLTPLASQAETITFDFTGHVTSVYDPFGIVGSLITTGDPVLASLRYDTTTPDLYPGDPTRGTYLNTPGWLKVAIDGLGFEQTSSIQVDVLHGFVATGLPQELLQGLFVGTPTAWPDQLPTFTYSSILLGIGQTTPPFSLLSSDALPTSIDLSKADIRSGLVRSGTQEVNMYEIQFGTAIPEPRTATLLVGGLLLCGLCSLKCYSARAEEPLRVALFQPNAPGHAGFEAPVVYWMPAIGISGMAFYTGDKLPKWKADVFVGALRTGEIPGAGHLKRILFNEQMQELRRESLLTELRQRIRDVRQGPDGLLYVLTDVKPGAVLRIEPAPESAFGLHRSYQRTTEKPARDS